METAAIEGEMRSVEVCGHWIPVVDGTEGQSGPAVVLIHGIGMTVHLWPELLKQSGLGRCRWVSMGLPGHYPGGVPAGFEASSATAELFGNSVLGVIRECFGDEPAHVVGWSTGGFSGLCAAAMSVVGKSEGAACEGGRVASVISICGFGRGGWGSVLGTMQRLSGSAWGRGLQRCGMRFMAATPWLLRRIFRLLSGRDWAESPEVRAALEVVLRDFGRHDVRVMTSLFEGLFRQDISEAVRGLECPVLLVAGERDPVIPLSEARHLQGLIPRSRLVVLSGAGHMFFGEALEECRVLMREWLLELSGEGVSK